MAQYKRGRLILLFLLFILAGCVPSPKGDVVIRGEDALSAADEARSKKGGSSDEEDTALSDGTEPGQILVHVCGEVKNPGVYGFSPGSRVIDAVEAAGGFTKKADPESLNLAEELADASKIRVLSVDESDKKEAAGGDGAQPGDGRVDLNTATLEELMSLPGIGQKRAEAILALRQEKGVFQKTEDLLDAEGIKEGIFRKIKDLIKV